MIIKVNKPWAEPQVLTRGVRVVLLARSPAWCWPVPTWALPNAWALFGDSLCQIGLAVSWAGPWPLLGQLGIGFKQMVLTQESIGAMAKGQGCTQLIMVCRREGSCKEGSYV